MKEATTTKTSYHIPVGPIHPALKEPVYFEFEISGERIVDVDVSSLKKGSDRFSLESYL